ncbi:MAG: N-acetyltransferase [Alphaproteobacteria bacterium]|nr:MAG: N-acetyltransferase [Alphaproteobacteria bacterium]
MLCDGLVIAPSTPADEAAIFDVERDAFGRDDEARLALALMAAPAWTLSVVARRRDRVIGHVLLTEIGAPVRAAALAPLAVAAPYREMQVGSRLVADALERARQAGFEAVFVLGDNLYYERFGFSAALATPFAVEWQGPHFMALELVPGALAGKAGRLDYPPAFFAAA